MIVSKETQEKINFLFKTNPEIADKLSNCDPEAIREIGILSQRGINPNDVIIAYKSGDPESLKQLYQQAKRLLLLQELYKDLCFEHYTQTKGTSENLEDVNSKKNNIKK